MLNKVGSILHQTPPPHTHTKREKKSQCLLLRLVRTDLSLVFKLLEKPFTLYHTIPTYDDPKKKTLLEKDNVFFPSQNKFQFLSQI